MAVAEVIPLGARLKQRREELGLSQTQAARELAVARTAYRLWEMEAARPAPDRWRVIAKWLGISMTALLLAGEMLDEQEALDAEEIAGAAGLTSAGWDDASDASAGDYFSQQRAMIADQAETGGMSTLQAASLRHLLTRIQDATMDDASHGWHPGQFVKRFPNTVDAPRLARAALTATAVGIPNDAYESAALLTSELVTNSVEHSNSVWIDVEVILGAGRLRIAVSDQSSETLRPRTPDIEGGWGLALISELANRWGVERHTVGMSVWVEFDLAGA
jgi:anti-sigma regulatory factor (Ser/Thr protein kinase)/transcriptional regulator with XRE-family HTH domain